MTLSVREKQAVSISLFKSPDFDIQYLLGLVGPYGEAVKIIVSRLQSLGISDGVIKCLAIAYSLDVATNRKSRSGCTTAECPVMGSFVANLAISSTDTFVDEALSLLSSLPPEINPLSLAEVFPARLLAVRAKWIKEAEVLFPAVTSLNEDANTIDWLLGLSDFIPGMPKPGCKGSSCPGKPVLVAKT